jgi:A/G-specific adenine glycosylase
MTSLTPENPSAPAALKRWLGQRLLTWFAHHQRDLPWRKDRDPYRVWVSEVMLQQTQVATVIPYFLRFLAAFPTLADLAAAGEQDVLRLWEGLGYYRRARDLHRAARVLVKEFGGVIPSDPASLQGVPGMGRYTRNAVLSQAFDLRLPILEANTQRVLCRVFGRTEDPTRNPLRAWLWQIAAEILPHQHAGDFNQALMELGALVCTPTFPRCDRCPLASKCEARQRGLQETIPFRSTPGKVIDVNEVAVVPRRGARVLLAQRPAAGRWANLWEFPHGELLEIETHEQAAVRILRELAGLGGCLGTELLTIRHTVNRYRITMVCFEATCATGNVLSTFYRAMKWVRPSELDGFPISAPQRRLARALVEQGRQRLLF